VAVAVVVAVDVVDGKPGQGHGHDQVYDHDPPRLPRDQGAPLIPREGAGSGCNQR
jgi:hypothetical protein